FDFLGESVKIFLKSGVSCLRDERLCHLIFLFFSPILLFAQPPYFNLENKINGMSFRAPRIPPLVDNKINEIKNSNANWVAIVPEATLERTTLKLRPDDKNDWWGETIDANIEVIKSAKNAGFKIMLKPQIVLSKLSPNTRKINFSFKKKNSNKLNIDKTRGVEWRGDFEAKNESDWKIWEASYEAYILNLARVADSLNVELFCIGNEMRQSAVKRPDFWRQLIKKTRAIYDGPLTYSANWDEYDKITFWNELDFIGLDTYFPINSSAIPSVKKTVKNWKPILRRLKKFSKKNKRQIIITEFGYRNIEYAGRRPWLHDFGKDEMNNDAQFNLYEAFFQAFWHQKWVAGGFLWQWFHTLKNDINTTYSPQGKPALEVVRKWYGQ
ncbi:MAG: hypothetical protein AAFZ15_10300, partial [Bacteroidota bacterium]